MRIGEIIGEVEVLPEEIDLGQEIPEEPGIEEPVPALESLGSDRER